MASLNVPSPKPVQVSPRMQSQRPSSSRQHRSRPAGPSHAQRSSYTPRSTNVAVAASPEMMTSLVESLSKITAPTNPSYYGAPSSSPHNSVFPPSGGTVRNVEYAYLDDEAALAPVVRTSKPPSGFSPITNGSMTNGNDDSKRMSCYAGVDIPSYVRNYMNRVDREETLARGKAAQDTASRRASWSSSKKGYRLSYVSSWEKMKRGSGASIRSLDGSLKERELRMSTTGVLHASDAGGNPISTEDLAGGRHIPARGASYGKGEPGLLQNNNHTSNRYPPAATTLIPPPQMASLSAAGATIVVGDGQDAAPPPGLPRQTSGGRRSAR